MIKRIVLFTSVLLVVLIAFTSCSTKQLGNDPEKTPENTDELNGELFRETIVYYADDAGYLIPVMRRIPWVEGIAKATLRVMMDTPDQQESLMMMGLRPLLPEDAEILGMSIKDGVAKVDFNEAVLNCKDAVAETNMVQGVVLTLAGFSTIDKVQFMFNGKIIDKMPFGTKVGEPISPMDINVETYDGVMPDGAKVTVYFQSTSVSQYDYLIPVTRITNAMNATFETALEELLAGPKDTDNMTIDIPQGTKLLGLQMTNGVTYINFSKEFSSLAADPNSEAMVLRAIKMVASHFPEIEQLEILVDGKKYVDATQIDDIPVFANEYD
ncbi:MAG TPA: GerMN domain-containing protein [Candidatus Atribacteria bacterium]|nr:GerMN domain-containing protein [Candidatus Atribacteria bacterium]HPT79382.1 GerMN domain-containing protein [Candidatus Atribacteria bacterium]